MESQRTAIMVLAGFGGWWWCLIRARHRAEDLLGFGSTSFSPRFDRADI